MSHGQEWWRPVSGKEGAYEVSDKGSVRSLPRSAPRAGRNGGRFIVRYPGRDLTPQKLPNGYMGVQLGKGRSYLVHRLVAEAFVHGDTNLQVNHKNGDRSDNRAENLEWLSCSDNHRHSYRELTRKQHALTREVVFVSSHGESRYPSVLAASKALGVSPGSVSSAALRGHLCLGQEVTYG